MYSKTLNRCTCRTNRLFIWLSIYPISTSDTNISGHWWIRNSILWSNYKVIILSIINSSNKQLWWILLDSNSIQIGNNLINIRSNSSNSSTIRSRNILTRCISNLTNYRKCILYILPYFTKEAFYLLPCFRSTNSFSINIIINPFI